MALVAATLLLALSAHALPVDTRDTTCANGAWQCVGSSLQSTSST